MKYIFYTILSLFVLVSCKTSKNYLERSDNDNTLFDAVKTLKKSIKELMTSQLTDRGFVVESVLLKSIILPIGLTKATYNLPLHFLLMAKNYRAVIH